MFALGERRGGVHGLNCRLRYRRLVQGGRFLRRRSWALRRHWARWMEATILNSGGIIFNSGGIILDSGDSEFGEPAPSRSQGRGLLPVGDENASNLSSIARNIMGVATSLTLEDGSSPRSMEEILAQGDKNLCKMTSEAFAPNRRVFQNAQSKPNRLRGTQVED